MGVPQIDYSVFSSPVKKFLKLGYKSVLAAIFLEHYYKI